MRAAVYHGPGDVRISDVEDPAVEDPRDVIVRTITASMCGSDLYLYGVEVGNAVGRFSVGDRVTFPYSVSCGTCFSCRMGQTAHCETSGRAIYGFGVAFVNWEAAKPSMSAFHWPMAIWSMCPPTSATRLRSSSPATFRPR